MSSIGDARWQSDDDFTRLLPIFGGTSLPHNAFHSTSTVCAESVCWAASRAGAFAGIWSAWPQPCPESLRLVVSD